jgi:hypothetical protein
MNTVHFGEIQELMSVAGVAGAAFFQANKLEWNRIPNFTDHLIAELGTDITTLCHEYGEVGRSIEEIYFCFATSAWLGILREESLLMVHLENGAPLGRVISAGRRFLGTT